MAKAEPQCGHHSVTPYMVLSDAGKAIEFYKQAFGAEEVDRFEMKGRIGHAELRIGDSLLMMADEQPDCGALSPNSVGGSPVSMMLYVDDADAMVAQALRAGARELQPVEDQLWGDRSGCVADPFGYKWFVSTHQEDVPHDEIRRRMTEKFGA